MNKQDNSLKIILFFIICIILDFSLPILGLNYYLFLTPLLILYFVTKTNVSFSVWLLFPFIILLDLYENILFFGFYTLYFGISFLIIRFLKKTIPRIVLSYLIYLSLFAIFFYLNSTLPTAKWFLLSFVEFTLVWYILDKKVF